MKTQFTPLELTRYFDIKNKERYHYYRDRSVKIAKDLRIHADGLYPECLLDERRPNETLEVKDYRKKIWIAKTKPFFSKVESTLNKIRRSTDWNINYKNSNFDRVVEGEGLEDYCEKNYPTFESVTNWCFSVLLRQYLIDANSLILVAPLESPELENTFIKPVATIFTSEDVIDFVDEDFAVVQNKTGAIYYSGGKAVKGDSFYLVTTLAIERYDQINTKRQFSRTLYYEHGLEFLPMFKLGGIVVECYGPHILYESRVSGIVPEFNEALREYSDLQAAKVLHLFPERWEYTQNECTNCKGTGKTIQIIENESCSVVCNVCNGRAYVASGPYSKMLVRPQGAGEQPLPTPPAGFVEKDVEIIKVQEQGVKDHIYYGLSSINFEFLAEKPLATSGVKTAMDGDEMNNTVHAVAEDLVRILDKLYRIIAIYRYSTQYTVEQIEEMLPQITVPEKYDIISSARLEEQLSTAKTNKINSVILNNMEIAYAAKIFNQDADIAEHVRLVLTLDPLSGLSEDDKMSRLSNKGITQLDYVISSNINSFVDRAIEEDEKFIELDILKQREKIKAYAEEQIAAQDEAKQIIDETIDPITGEPVMPKNPMNAIVQ